MTKPPMTPGEYADAVRAALADLPPDDREELLDDLDDHLAEIASESGMPLEERLGPPESYAAELRAAYGGRPTTTRPRRGGPWAWATGLIRAAHGRLLGLPAYREVVAFWPELRPAWWLVRGYVVALALLGMIGRGGPIPGDLAGWVLVVVLACGSVWLGRRPRLRERRWRRTLLTGADALAALLLLVLLTSWDRPDAQEVTFASPQMGRVWVDNAAGLGDEVYNILPYAADGTPLHDVRLYDQDGRPIIVNPEMFGQSVIVPCEGEPPIRNAYPLPLSSFGAGEWPRPKPGGPGCVPTGPTPSASPSAAPSVTPSAADASATPSPSAEPGPSESGSAEPGPSESGSSGTPKS
ncbi:hypothetical protein JOL79_25750 [Microbispora sp. RL4-1S]|uniref:Uncharacterized protein n=1 Tax=Microbispora oryzae TaxID=2806554 RepID=A0A940WQ35_9ACTN|nr:hypothetical protein [Microbispora oryzae]MBP2707193.1 hypothetical protein [Microbispora oryzae]